MANKPFITVSIKTLNEAECIEKTIDSIQQQIADYPHKIIVADSLSTDNTQQLASAKGVTVVSLTQPADRCCGVGHQLGYLYSEGQYLLLMDGDMELEKGFIDSAVTFLEAHPEYAGVAGTVEMDDAANYEFKSRKQRLHEIYPIGDCDHLGGGGLYRRVAIEKIGYLTNRNLHAFEEAELGMRLLHAGYKLHRLDVPYFSHTSHNMPTFKLIMYRWRSGYNQATGELLRSAWGRPYLSHVLRMVKNEIIFSIYMFLLLVSILTFNAEIIGVALLPLLAFIILKAIKNRSLINGLHSVINLAVLSAGLVKGLTHPVRDPMVPPDSKVIHE
ncbi:putative glycosyltransferase protein [Buttiauxella gaviniae ATCC 51604]|uniref:Putative glycosyltransferase protein n=1 Tax=Buttiauxella gaviniae ATCC 51604 TaxID=1354253 RepID=A0A1B7I5G7_9ENTR|nr:MULTISPECIES: glycosyltransferase [Buttiauxella]OAT23651.1 putative glycosyltransferase protein [Buttiauxella gaviniae ATCC 51604]TDX14708.1 cellulose synthase/poly-beta-1,6-N-acetylglucosamine synthase-like glycosyltransferase [Buttiauxella sp. BIGb0552]